MTLRSVSSLSLLLLLLYTSRSWASYDKVKTTEVKRVSTCYASQLAPLSSFWRDVVGESYKGSCSNDNCMMLWGKTIDNRTRILAQGCSAGSMYSLRPGEPKMQNECPSGTGIGPGIQPLFIGEEGADILRTLTHVQICMCQSNWCNNPPKYDGQSCEGDDSPFCNPLTANREPEAPQNYSVEAILEPSESGVTPQYNESAELTYYEQVIQEDPDVNAAWWNTLKGFLPFVVVLLIIIGAVCVLLVALVTKFICTRKPDQDSIELLGYNGSQRKKLIHTSGRLNSIAQVTILTEVAQGYKQEAEDLIRECHAGGLHQIANWKYDSSAMLGTGSFGAVYRVEMKPDYLVDSRVAAIKTFDHRASTHFFNESRTLRYVHDFKNHPNIIQYLGRAVDCRDSLEMATWRIALELCEGGALREWLQSTHITLTQYLEASSGLLSALTFLHCEESAQTSLLSNFRGNSTDSGNPDSRSSRRSSKQAGTTKKKFRIAHCDINSRNVLVRNPITGNVVLSDFGLALTDKERRQEEVQIREIGTIRYLSPEMLQSQINLSDAIGSLILADTYATGLVLWELLSRTVELYEDDFEVPVYSPPYEKELKENEGSVVNRVEAMVNVVVRRGVRPLWGGKWNDMKEKEEEAMSKDEDSELTEEEKFLHSTIVGINSMLVRDPEARLTIPAMAEKTDTYRLQRQRIPEREVRSREDSLLDETSGSI